MTTVEERKIIYRLSESNHTCAEISDHLGLKLSTVKKWRARLKKGVRLKAIWDVPKKVQ